MNTSWNETGSICSGPYSPCNGLQQLATICEQSEIFEWNLLDDEGEQVLSEEEWQQKYDDIISCLHGQDDGTVDLVELRRLASSPGGLLCPDLRKRAWPMLLSAFEKILMKEKSVLLQPTTNSVQRLKETMKLRYRFGARDGWAVFEHQLWDSHYQKKPEPVNSRSTKRCIGMDGVSISTSDSLNGLSPLPSPAEGSQNGNDSRVSPTSVMDKNIFCTKKKKKVTFAPESSRLDENPAFRHEQRVILNAIYSWLRTVPGHGPYPTETTTFHETTEFSPRHIFDPQLVPLTAMLMINVRSPSIATYLLPIIVSYPQLGRPLETRPGMYQERTVEMTCIALWSLLHKNTPMPDVIHHFSELDFLNLLVAPRSIRVASRLFDAWLADPTILPYVLITMIKQSDSTDESVRSLTEMTLDGERLDETLDSARALR